MTSAFNWLADQDHPSRLGIFLALCIPALAAAADVISKWVCG